MNGQFDKLLKIAQEAAKVAKLDARRGGFDGDEWVWAWRENTEAPNKKACVTEASLRLREYPEGERAEFTVTAGAWLRDTRRIALAHPVARRLVALKEIEKEKNDLIKDLGSGLGMAKREADELRKKLPEYEAKNDDLLRTLREKGFLR